MTGHTPGPWLYRGKSSSVHEPCDTHPYGRQIFRFHEGHNDEDLPSEADLSVVLAAPQLLMALAEAQGVFQGLADEGLSCTARELADKYAAVLAKARGL